MMNFYNLKNVKREANSIQCSQAVTHPRTFRDLYFCHSVTQNWTIKAQNTPK